jgi:hypothetical protein
MLRRVILVRTDVSEESSASIIRVKRIDDLGTTLEVTTNRCKLRRNISYKTSVLTKAILRNIPEDGILYSQHRENLKTYLLRISCKQTFYSSHSVLTRENVLPLLLNSLCLWFTILKKIKRKFGTIRKYQLQDDAANERRYNAMNDTDDSKTCFSKADP